MPSNSRASEVLKPISHNSIVADTVVHLPFMPMNLLYLPISRPAKAAQHSELTQDFKGLIVSL